MHINNPRDCHYSPKYLNMSLSLFLAIKVRDHSSGGCVCDCICLVTCHSWKSHIHYFSSVHTSSCSTAFKLSRMIGYINFHIAVNFQSKKTCISKAMVWFVLSLPKYDTSRGWAGYTINELAHKRGPAAGGIQAVRTAPLGYFWLSSRGSAKPSQAPATL